MSKMIFNGLEFVAGQEINNNGVFVDTSNVIVSETVYSGSFSYVATQDCAVVVNFCGSSGGSGWVFLDGEVIGGVYTTSGAGISGDTYFVKKGQTISATSQVISGVSLSYTVYGLQSGSVSNVQHNYSTSEQLIGTWIDGKPLYERTFVLTSGITIGGYINIALDTTTNKIKNLDGYIERSNGAIDKINGYIQSDDTARMAIRIDKIEVYISSVFTGVSELWVTIQYTKTTD